MQNKEPWLRVDAVTRYEEERRAKYEALRFAIALSVGVAFFTILTAVYGL